MIMGGKEIIPPYSIKVEYRFRLLTLNSFTFHGISTILGAP